MTRLSQREVFIAGFKQSAYAMIDYYPQLTKKNQQAIDKALDLAANEWYDTWVANKKELTTGAKQASVSREQSKADS